MFVTASIKFGGGDPPRVAVATNYPEQAPNPMMIVLLWPSHNIDHVLLFFLLILVFLLLVVVVGFQQVGWLGSRC